MKEERHNRLCIIGFHLCDTYRIIKSITIETNTLDSRYGFFPGAMETFLKLIVVMAVFITL